MDQTDNSETRKVVAGEAPHTPSAEVKAEAKIQYSENKTIDDVVGEADEIFEKYKKALLKYRRDNGLPEKYKAQLTVDQQLIINKERDRLLKKYQEEHKKFTQAYPLVLRFMIQSGEYNTGVFRRFLNYMVAHPYKTEDEYFTIYSEYSKMLYRHYNPRADSRILSAVQENAKKCLKEEKSEFEKLTKKFDEEYEERAKRAIEMKKKLVADILLDMERGKILQ